MSYNKRYRNKKRRRPPRVREITPLEVRPRPGESPEQLLKRFKKIVKKDGVLQLFRDRRYFVKDSTKRNLKKRYRKYKLELARKKREEK